MVVGQEEDIVVVEAAVVEAAERIVSTVVNQVIGPGIARLPVVVVVVAVVSFLVETGMVVVTVMVVVLAMVAGTMVESMVGIEDMTDTMVVTIVGIGDMIGMMMATAGKDAMGTVMVAVTAMGAVDQPDMKGGTKNVRVHMTVQVVDVQSMKAVIDNGQLLKVV